MGYKVKELFYSLQGEGANAGRPSIFVRFAGCNLWSGREEDRHRGPSCSRWCDTDFVGTDGSGGGNYSTARDLAVAVLHQLPADADPTHLPLVVCTGGEPLLQIDRPLFDALHTLGYSVAVETNGTMPVPEGVDWVCVSPKANTKLVVTGGDELKVVIPQPGLDPAAFTGLAFEHFSIQPMDGPDLAANSRLAIDYCLKHPRWRLSVQAHKLLGLR